jgi:Spy/CpxP family protein refolding chaperone
MKVLRLLVLVCLGFGLFSKMVNGAESAGSDPVAEHLFPPELILHNGEAIGLSDAKREEVQSRVMKAQERFEEVGKELKNEQEALAGLLDKEKPDEDAVLKQLDSVIAREREMRREQFTLLLSLRGMLTPEQQAQLKTLRKKYNPSAIETRLKDKMSIIESKMQDLASNGRDPSAIAQKMQEFPELMRLGKVKAAEALLDGVLKELDAK